MQYAYEFVVNRPLSQVWAFVTDIPGLLRCIPGCQSAEQQADGAVSAVVAERVGPFKVEFHLQGTTSADPAAYTLKATAGGKDIHVGSTMNLSLDLRLAAEGEEQTRVAFQADVTILGKLATLGFSIMKDKAQKTMQGFAEQVRKRLEEGAA